MPVDTELYDLLGVSQDASEGESPLCSACRGKSDILTDEIKKAYRKKVRLLCSCASASTFNFDHITQAKEHHPVSSTRPHPNQPNPVFFVF